MRNTGFQFPSKRINDNNAAVDRSAMTGGGKMKVERAVTSCLQVVWRDDAGRLASKPIALSVDQVHLCCKQES